MEVTEGKVGEEQGGFRKGNVSVYQIFASKMMIEYVRKGERSI